MIAMSHQPSFKCSDLCKTFPIEKCDICGFERHIIRVFDDNLTIIATRLCCGGGKVQQAKSITLPDTRSFFVDDL
jgi:hypothetical protein